MIFSIPCEWSSTRFIQISKLFEGTVVNIFSLISFNMFWVLKRIETVLFSTHNLFWLRNKKTIFSVMHS